VLGPADTGYDAARVCFNAVVDRRPAVIVQCAGPRDVATAFDFARVHGLQVAVRGGGHSPAGHCVLDGGIVIDLSRLRGVESTATSGSRGPRADRRGSTSIRRRRRTVL
jgi:FAD/FMN-containing dehydrogenase